MSGPTLYHLFFALSLLILTTLFLRLLTILPAINPRPPPPQHTAPSQTHLMIVLGSGGHTAEMLSMLRSLPLEKYRFRTYVVSSRDDFSARKAREFETGRRACTPGPGGAAGRHEAVPREEEAGAADEGEKENPGSYCIRTIPRARKIHQPLWSTAFTSIQTLCASLRILITYPPGSSIGPRASSPLPPLPSPTPSFEAPSFASLPHPHPTLILTNGPGTSLVLVLACLLLKFVDFQGCWSRGCMRTVYVESWARCQTLSLTGRILEALGAVDRFLVQWEGLATGRREFRGVLVG